MKIILTVLSCLVLCFSTVVAESPPKQVPPTPQISAAKAIELADAHVAKTFPKDSSLYCQSARLEDSVMRPVRAYQHWDLVYRHAGAARAVNPKSGHDTFGDFHVYVSMTGDVTHEL